MHMRLKLTESSHGKLSVYVSIKSFLTSKVKAEQEEESKSESCHENQDEDDGNGNFIPRKGRERRIMMKIRHGHEDRRHFVLL